MQFTLSGTIEHRQEITGWLLDLGRAGLQGCRAHNFLGHNSKRRQRIVQAGDLYAGNPCFARYLDQRPDCFGVPF